MHLHDPMIEIRHHDVEVARASFEKMDGARGDSAVFPNWVKWWDWKHADDLITGIY